MLLGVTRAQVRQLRPQAIEFPVDSSQGPQMEHRSRFLLCVLESGIARASTQDTFPAVERD